MFYIRSLSEFCDSNARDDAKRNEGLQTPDGVKRFDDILYGEDGELKPIGTVRSEKSGICLQAFTTEPAIQLYSGNFLHCDPVPYGKNGIRYPKNGGFCLEAQHYPDAMRHPHFPSTVLRPGETYRQKTIYRFTTE